MNYVSLGLTGLMVTPVCLGTMNFGDPTDKTESFNIMDAAFDAGVIFWDTANSYHNGLSEEIVGDYLQQRGRREDIVLATKVYNRRGPGPNDRGLSKRHIMLEVEKSLRRLKTDWIDLYQLHRPDPSTPLEETAEALDACVRAGKVRYWGTSTFPSWQMAELWWTAKAKGTARPCCEQAPYNILDRRVEVDRVAFLREYGWGLLCWSPLAAGVLAGRYSKADVATPPTGSRLASSHRVYNDRINAAGVAVYEKVAEMAADLGVTPAQYSLAWLLARPGVTAPILGPRTVDQFAENLKCLDVKIPSEHLEEIDRLVPPGTAVANFHNTAAWFGNPLGG